MTSQEKATPLGTPEHGTPDPDPDPDFADEHADTAVSKDITAGDDDTEPESPDGWSGLEQHDERPD
jgi:hypothetical protein